MRPLHGRQRGGQGHEEDQAGKVKSCAKIGVENQLQRMGLLEQRDLHHNTHVQVNEHSHQRKGNSCDAESNGCSSRGGVEECSDIDGRSYKGHNENHKDPIRRSEDDPEALVHLLTAWGFLIYIYIFQKQNTY